MRQRTEYCIQGIFIFITPFFKARESFKLESRVSNFCVKLPSQCLVHDGCLIHFGYYHKPLKAFED
jgi:hypothetical protein